MAAKGALVGLLFLLKTVNVVGHKTFRHLDVNLPFGLLDRVLGGYAEHWAKIDAFFGSKPEVSSLITSGSRAKFELTKYPSLVRHSGVCLQAELKIGDLAGLAVADQPVVGVAAVVAVFDDAHIVVDGIGILQGLARAHEFRLAMGSQPSNWVMVVSAIMIPAEFTREVVVTGNDAGKAIHQNAVAVLRHDVEDHDPARPAR